MTFHFVICVLCVKCKKYLSSVKFSFNSANNSYIHRFWIELSLQRILCFMSNHTYHKSIVEFRHVDMDMNSWGIGGSWLCKHNRQGTVQSVTWHVLVVSVSAVSWMEVPHNIHGSTAFTNPRVWWLVLVKREVWNVLWYIQFPVCFIWWILISMGLFFMCDNIPRKPFAKECNEKTE